METSSRKSPRLHVHRPADPQELSAALLAERVRALETALAAFADAEPKRRAAAVLLRESLTAPDPAAIARARSAYRGNAYPARVAHANVAKLAGQLAEHVQWVAPADDDLTADETQTGRVCRIRYVPQLAAVTSRDSLTVTCRMIVSDLFGELNAAGRIPMPAIAALRRALADAVRRLDAGDDDDARELGERLRLRDVTELAQRARKLAEEAFRVTEGAKEALRDGDGLQDTALTVMRRLAEIELQRAREPESYPRRTGQSTTIMYPE